MPGFLFFRYQHPTKNAKNKETCSQEELERSANAWATEFVEKNLRPQLTSWLQELDGFFPEQLPFSTFRIGRTCFTAMAVMENYHSTSHTDRDLSNSVISWFLEGKCALLHVSVLKVSSFLEKTKKREFNLSDSILTPHNCEHVWSLNRRSRIRKGICISCARNVFQTPTWDNHHVPI